MRNRTPERILCRKPGDDDWSARHLVPAGRDRGFSADQLQKLVSGLFDALPIGRGFVLIYNEEGELHNLPPCIGLPRPGSSPLFIVGPAAIVRAHEGSYVGMTEDEERMAREGIQWVVPPNQMQGKPPPPRHSSEPQFGGPVDLMKLVKNAVRADRWDAMGGNFKRDVQMNMTVSDADSFKAASATLEHFGSQAVAYWVTPVVGRAYAFEVLFTPDTARKALRFYNDLPDEMP